MAPVQEGSWGCTQLSARLGVWSCVGAAVQLSLVCCPSPGSKLCPQTRCVVVAAAHAQGWSITAKQQPTACTALLTPAALAHALSAFVQLLVTQSHVVPSNRYFPELNHPKEL